MTPKDVTPHGAIETRQDATVCARVFGEHRDEIAGILVVLPNFGDEPGVSLGSERCAVTSRIFADTADGRTGGMT